MRECEKTINHFLEIAQTPFQGKARLSSPQSRTINEKYSQHTNLIYSVQRKLPRKQVLPQKQTAGHKYLDCWINIYCRVLKCFASGVGN